MRVQVATSLPTHIPTLHQMLLEQQQLIESLKTQLHRLLKHRFGPRTESIDVNQVGLFGSLIVEVPEEASERGRPRTNRQRPSAPRARKRCGFSRTCRV